MLASIGLATICQAIKAMIAAGLEVVSEAKPTATTHRMPVAEQGEAEAVEDQSSRWGSAGSRQMRRYRSSSRA